MPSSLGMGHSIIYDPRNPDIGIKRKPINNNYVTLAIVVKLMLMIALNINWIMTNPKNLSWTALNWSKEFYDFDIDT